MRLWMDDIRLPPDDTWTWARTNNAALRLLRENEVVECSLDHDLGLHNLDPAMINHPDVLMGQGKETGYDLVREMCEQGLVPPKVRIHSWNPIGARKMAAHLNDFGHDVVIQPFDASERHMI